MLPTNGWDQESNLSVGILLVRQTSGRGPMMY
jgi:hypothetical protein